jgi:signal transduction histidine kinase
MTDAVASVTGEATSDRTASGVRMASQAMAAQLVVNLAGALAVALLFDSSVPAALLQPWLLTFSGFWLARVALLLSFIRAAPSTADRLGRWRRLWTAGLLVSASLWGAGGWLFYPHLGGVDHDVLFIIGYTLCIAAVPVLLNHPRAFMLFPVLFFGPIVVRIATSGQGSGLSQAGVLLLIFALTLLLVKQFRRSLLYTFELQQQADQLLKQLRIEKSSADAARGAAEAANRAKTQFFVAASHDLRQPLHAMGLLASALRHKNLDVESAHLVGSINESVDALEGLFSQLLDLTRLDSGVIEAQPQRFGLNELYRKLRLRFEPLAFEKGLALRFRGASHHVWADLLLVERIVHNLVSNAIRYTGDGTVLIGCRRRGDRLLLQVWDTGPGIDEREQGRVFDELYQVPNELRADSPHRRGLGLGLSIVRRLAALMDAPITLHSRKGHGSVFTLELPVGPAQSEREPPLPPPARPHVGLTLKGRQIIVVEDDPDVSSSLETMLVGWVAEVVALNGEASCAAWMAANPAAAPPDLLLVGHSMESEGSGLDIIVSLRGHFGEVTPAIVVGDNALPVRDMQAQHSRVHLMLKPVVPVKLRALIGFKLGEVGH